MEHIAKAAAGAQNGGLGSEELSPTIAKGTAREGEDMDMVIGIEKEILNLRSHPLRQYLADNIIPVLTAGLIDVTRDMPDDPIEYLATFFENF